MSTDVAESNKIMKPFQPLGKILALATLLSMELHAIDWPEFRGPDRNGISQAKNVPLKWSAEGSENIRWTTEVPGKGWSSPTLRAGKLYLTSAVETDGVITLNALCIDAETGRIIWNVPVFTPEPADATRMHKKNTAASPTAIAVESAVYVHFGHMGTATLSYDGKVVWKQDSLKYKPVHGTGGSPALVGDLLVFSADGQENPFVAALDRHTGKVAWRQERNTHAKKNFSFSTPQIIAIGGQVQIISPGSGFVAAYAPSDGRELWRVQYGEGYSVVPRPVYDGERLYLSSGFDAATALAVRPAGATGDVSESHVDWIVKKGAPHTPSMILSNGLLFMVSDAGIATCADSKTGEAVWSERIPGNYSASPVLAEGRIYFLNEAGLTTVVRADRVFEVLSSNDLAEKSLASPTPDDGSMYVRTETKLHRIGR